MKYAIVDNKGIIQNLIAYDGKSSFNAPQGSAISQVNDWLNIGDNINATQPVEHVLTDEEKAQNLAAKQAVDPLTQIAMLTALLISNGTIKADDLPSAQVDAANVILASSGADTIPVLNAQPVKVGL